MISFPNPVEAFETIVDGREEEGDFSVGDLLKLAVLLVKYPELNEALGVYRFAVRRAIRNKIPEAKKILQTLETVPSSYNIEKNIGPSKTIAPTFSRLDNGDTIRESFQFDVDMEFLGNNYLSPEAIKRLLEEKTNGLVTLSSEDVVSARKSMPSKLSEAMKIEISKIKNASEEDSMPLVHIIPQYIITKEDYLFFDETGEEKRYKAGSKVPFTVRNAQKVMEIAKQYDPNLKDAWYNRSYASDVVNQISEGKLRVSSSTCLKESKNKKYDSQIRLREQTLGKGYEIYVPNVYLSLVLHYLKTGESLWLDGPMRLDTLGTDGDPLRMHSDYSSLNLSTSIQDADDDEGLGVSVEIS